MNNDDDQAVGDTDKSENTPAPPAFDPDHGLVKREIGNENPRPSPR